MTSFRQILANRQNALKSTGPKTDEGKQRSRCNAVRHGLAAETVIGALENAEDYKAFEAAVTADYDAESAVERELILRLASLLWRLRRATTMETGLLQIQAENLQDLREARQLHPGTQELLKAVLRRDQPAYEATLWRQVGQILLILDVLDRRKPQERRRTRNSAGLPRPLIEGID
jgi:hypothetical protein